MVFTRSISRLWRVRWFRYLFLFLSVWLAVHVAYITYDGLKDFGRNSDVAIVLGNRVFGNGSLAPWTKGRVNKALELYRHGRVKRIFVSGGRGGSDNYPEGRAMKAYLVTRGVPDSLVIEDNNGRNTFLTARNFVSWNAGQPNRSVVVISQFYHLTRAKYILKKSGFKGTVYSSPSTVFSWMDIWGTLREVPAFYFYAVWY